MLTPLSKPCLIIGLVCCCVSPQELFGLDSVHWQGSSHTKGLAQQVAALQAVAAAPVNSRRWRCPAVVVFFPSGVSAEVAAALRAMGVAVADGPGKDFCPHQVSSCIAPLHHQHCLCRRSTLCPGTLRKLAGASGVLQVRASCLVI